MTASSELEPKIPPPIQEVQDRFNPEVERQLQELGAQIRPASPQSAQDDHGQPLTQPVGDTQAAPAQTVTIPTSPQQAATWSHGSVSDSQTWLGVVILRKIKRALHFGWRILIGKES